MSKDKKPSTPAPGFQLDAAEGYAFLRAKEEDNAASSESRFGVTFDHYEFNESPKGYEVTVTVRVGQRETARKAEWAGFMAVKKRHPSIYGESKMAFQQGSEWLVMVRWMVWKPQDETGGIDFNS